MNAEASVSLRLKVIEEGLSNLTALLDGLKSNDAAVESLRQEAASLAAEITRLKAASDAESQATETLRQQLSDAESKLARAATATEGLSRAQRDAGASAASQRQSTQAATEAVVQHSAATQRATEAVRAAEAAVRAAAQAKTALGLPADTRAAQAALEAAKAQHQQATELDALEAAARAAAAQLLQAGGSSEVFTAKLPKPDAVQELVAQLGRLGSAIDPDVAARAKSLGDELARLAKEQRDAQQAAQAQAAAVAQARDALTTLQQRTEQLTQRMRANDQAVEDYIRLIGGAKNATAEEAQHLAFLADRARTSRIAFLEHNAAIIDAERGLRELGVEVQRTATAERAASSVADQAAASTKKLGTSAAESTPALNGLKTQITQVAQAVGAYFAVQQAGQMLWDTGKVADGWNDLRAALTNALGPQTDVNRAMQDAVALSLRTYTSLEATTTLYGQLARAGREIGVSQADALRLTETINKAAQVVKTSAGAAEAGVTQLLQGLRSGVVRGDEFNSVMENSPRLAQAMADGLGVTVGQLRNLAEQGQLTTQTVINALQSQAGAIDAEFGRLPLTIARSVSELQTRWAELVGTFDQSSGASGHVAQMIEGIANNLEKLAEVATRAGAVVVAAMAVQAVTALRAAATEMIATGAAARLLSADLATLGKPIQIVIAVAGFELGYEIGTMLYNNSEYARKLGIALTAFFENVVSDLQFVKEAGEALFTDDTVGAAFDRYRERGREMDAIFGQMWEGSKQAPQAVGAAADAASASLAQVSTAGSAAGAAVGAGAAAGAAGLGTMAAKANAVDEALSQIAAAGQAKLPQIGPSIDAQIVKLAALAKTSKDAGAQIASALPAALEKLNGTELTTVRAKLLAAFADPAIPAKVLTEITAAFARQAAQSLGVDVTAASTRMTTEFIQAKDALAVLLQSVDGLKSQGVDTATVVGQALSKMVDTAKSRTDLDALTSRVDALRVAGQLTEVQYIALTASISAKAQDVAGNVNSVADALLGKFGTSVQEVQTGVSAAAAKSITELDALTRTLDALGVKGQDAAPVLAKALDQSLQAATTEKAVQAVIDRWKELVAQGKVSGDQMAAGIEAARQKIDQLKPGLNSVDEALKKFGLATRGEMNQTAASMAAAWNKIRYDATVSIDAKREAFTKYSRAVMDANGGVITTEMQVQAKMLGVELAAEKAGSAGVAGMHQIRDAAAEAATAVGVLNTSLEERNKAVESAFAADAAKRTGGGAVVGGNTLMSVINDLKGYGLDDAAAQKIAREFVDTRGEVPYMNNPGQAKYGGPNSTLSSALQAAASQYLYGKDGTGGEVARRAAAAAAPAPAPAASGQSSAPAPSPASTTSRTVYAVAITINRGREETVDMASQEDAQALVSMLRRLESDAARVGG